MPMQSNVTQTWSQGHAHVEQSYATAYEEIANERSNTDQKRPNLSELGWQCPGALWQTEQGAPKVE